MSEQRYSATQDSSTDVRKEMCQALCLLVEVKADFLADPQICQFVIEFLLWTTEHDTDYDVKKEACEFWSSLCENEEVILDTHTRTHTHIPMREFACLYPLDQADWGKSRFSCLRLRP